MDIDRETVSEDEMSKEVAHVTTEKCGHTIVCYADNTVHNTRTEDEFIFTTCDTNYESYLQAVSRRSFDFAEL